MGGSNSSEVFLSEKDPNNKGFDLVVRPSLEFHHEECRASTPEDDHEPSILKQRVQERDQEEEKDQEQCNNIVSEPAALNIKIPSHKSLEEGDPNDGFKTPTSSDHKIPVILQCPPAPRKPKAVASAKRKACRPRLFLDLSKEIESLFPTSIVEDVGSKITKKVKQAGNDGDQWG